MQNLKKTVVKRLGQLVPKSLDLVSSKSISLSVKSIKTLWLVKKIGCIGNPNGCKLELCECSYCEIKH